MIMDKRFLSNERLLLWIVTIEILQCNMNEYAYSQTTAATTVQCTTSVQQIGQRQTESTNRKVPLMQRMNNVTHPN